MSSIWTPGGEHPVRDHDQEPPPPPPRRTREAAQGGPGRGGLDPEQQTELEAQLSAMQEEVARTPASVVVANHAVGLFQLAAIHLDQRPPSLEQARLAIDAMAALVEGLKGRLGDEEQGLADGLAQARMAYVQLAGASAPQPG